MPFTKEYFDYLLEQNKVLLEQNTALTNEVSTLTNEVSTLTMKVEELSQTIKELTEKKNKNSRNSSKPPSTDGYNKPEPKSLRKPSGKKPGGQTGHDGSYLKVMAKPDETISHMPSKCEGCPHYNECRSHACITETRNVVDIDVNVSITAHEVYAIECPLCDNRLKGAFPKDVKAPVQYGTNLSALVVALNTVGALSIARTNEILSGVFNVPVATGTIAGMVLRCADAVDNTVTKIGQMLLDTYLAHCDETGTRVDGKTRWVHVMCSKFLTYLYLHDKRGKEAINDEGLLPVYHGIVVHDCWSSYWSCDGEFEHSVCCAHLLRELTGIIENHSEQEWAQQFMDLLLNMKKVVDKAKESGKASLSRYHINKFSKQYEDIIQKAYYENPLPESKPSKRGRKKKGKVRSLIERLDNLKTEVCRFTTDFNVPFDNNQAERDIRMVKTKTKVSGCFRSRDGATAYLKIMSYIGTAKKHGMNAYTAIVNAMSGNPDIIFE